MFIIEWSIFVLSFAPDPIWNHRKNYRSTKYSVLSYFSEVHLTLYNTTGSKLIFTYKFSSLKKIFILKKKWIPSICLGVRPSSAVKHRYLLPENFAGLQGTTSEAVSAKSHSLSSLPPLGILNFRKFATIRYSFPKYILLRWHLQQTHHQKQWQYRLT